MARARHRHGSRAAAAHGRAQSRRRAGSTSRPRRHRRPACCSLGRHPPWCAIWSCFYCSGVPLPLPRTQRMARSEHVWTRACKRRDAAAGALCCTANSAGGRHVAFLPVRYLSGCVVALLSSQHQPTPQTAQMLLSQVRVSEVAAAAAGQQRPKLERRLLWLQLHAAEPRQDPPRRVLGETRSLSAWPPASWPADASSLPQLLSQSSLRFAHTNACGARRPRMAAEEPAERWHG